MKTYTTRKVSTQYYDDTGHFIKREDKTFLDESNVTCDICKQKEGSRRWSSSYYDINEVEVCVTVKHKVGHSYPEGGNSTLYDFDICPACFKEHVIPFLVSKGCEIHEEESYW